MDAKQEYGQHAFKIEHPDNAALRMCACGAIENTCGTYREIEPAPDPLLDKKQCRLNPLPKA